MLRGLYNWTMDKASHPHAVGWLTFFCFVESSFFPIPPHPLLGLMCLAEPKKAVKFALIATLASVAGLIFLMNYGVIDFYIGFLAGIKAFTAAVLEEKLGKVFEKHGL